MSTIRTLLGTHHRQCDESFAAVEQAVEQVEETVEEEQKAE